MGESTEISWASATWNPWSGCTHVSPGCANCYMFAGKERWGQDPKKVVRSAPQTFNMPLSRKRVPPGSAVFTCSWSDWFHPVADQWRDEAWAVIRQRPDVLFLVLTKRAERIAQYLPVDWGDGYRNVVLGISAENQEWLERRYHYLRAVPAWMHMISFEPLLGPVSLDACDPEWWESKHPPLWAVIGGESGARHRNCKPEWIDNLVLEMGGGGHLIHVKQDSGLYPGKQGRIPDNVWALKDVPRLEQSIGRRCA
jgi:protein gp37